MPKDNYKDELLKLVRDFINPVFVKHCIKLVKTNSLFSSEILPEFNDNQIDEIINACLRAYQGYHDKFTERLATIIININKGHFLPNGNKRIAWILSLIFFLFEASYDKKNYSKENIVKIMKELKNLIDKVAGHKGNYEHESLVLEIERNINLEIQ